MYSIDKILEKAKELVAMLEEKKIFVNDTYRKDNL